MLMANLELREVGILVTIKSRTKFWQGQTVEQVGEVGNTGVPEVGNHHLQLQKVLLID